MSTDISVSTVRPGSDFIARTDLERKSDRFASANDAQNSVDRTAARRAKVIEAISSEVGSREGRLIIEQDQDTGRFVHKVVDRNSGETIEQWPEEEFLEVIKSMGDAYGLWVDQLV